MIIFLSFILLNSSLSGAINLFNNRCINNQSENLIKEVINSYFKTESSLEIIMPASSILNHFITIVHLPHSLHTFDSFRKGCNKPVESNEYGFIFFVPNTLWLTTEVVNVLQCYHQTVESFKTKRILIIDYACVSDINVLNCENVYLKYFQFLWHEYGLIHVIIHPIYQEPVKPKLILAYNPFRVQRSSKTGTLLKYNIHNNMELRLNDRFKNMHRYALKALMFSKNFSVEALLTTNSSSIKGGPELTLKWTLESYFNFRFTTYNLENYDEAVYNGSEKFILTEIFNSGADIVINFRQLKWDGYSKLQYLFPRRYTSVILMIEKKSPITGWKIILHLFRWQNWACIACTLLLCFICFAVFIQMHLKVPKRFGGKELLKALNFVLKPTLSISINNIPDDNSSRILMSAYLMFSIILSNLFTSQLIVLLRLPEPTNINSLQELQDLNIPVYSNFPRFLISNNGLPNLKNKVKYKTFKPDKGNNCSLRVSKNYAIIYSNTLFNINRKVALNQQCFENIHIIKEDVLQISFSQIMPIGSIYFEHFNLLAVRLFQYGFEEIWNRENVRFKRELQHFNTSDYQKMVQGNLKSLSFNDLTFHFHTLVYGLILSFFIFLTEVCLEKQTATQCY